MRKLFLICFFLISCVVCFGQSVSQQYPLKQNISSDSTQLNIKGLAKIYAGLQNAIYADTTAANLTRVKFYPAAQIFTSSDGILWKRNFTATAWVEIGSGGSGDIITTVNILNSTQWIVCYESGSCDTVTVSGDGNYWSTAGNSITGNKIIGTTNNRSFPVYTNNTFAAVVDSNQRLGVGTRFPTKDVSIKEKLYFNIEGSPDDHSVIEVPNGNTLILRGNTGLGEIQLVPRNNGGNIRAVDDAGGRVHFSFYSSGATEQGKLGLDQYNMYITALSDSTNVTFKSNGAASVLVDDSRFAEAYGTTTASANSMSLPFDGNSFTISGTTQINAITTYGWQPGSLLRFKFEDALVVKNNTAGAAGTAPILLSGRTDFTTADGDVLELLYDGVDWHEVGRSQANLSPNQRFGVLGEDDSYAENRSNNGHGIYEHRLDSMALVSIGLNSGLNPIFEVYDATGSVQRILSNSTQSNIYSPDGLNSFEVTNSGNFAYQLPITDTTIYLVGVRHSNGQLVKTLKSSLGSGTVTSFAFTDGNGFDGTVTDATTTPTLSLTTTVTDDQIMYSNNGAIVGSTDLTYNGNRVAIGGGTTVGVTNGLGIAKTGTSVNLTLTNGDQSNKSGLIVYNAAVVQTSLRFQISGTSTGLSDLEGQNVGSMFTTNVPLQIGTYSSVTMSFWTNNTRRANWITSGELQMLSRFEYAKGSDVAAANDLTLGAGGNLFAITGATQINAITTSSWQAGSEIAFIFTGAPLVKNNTAGGGGTATILLAGRTDFQAAAGDVLCLQYDGTNWYETQRSLASTAPGVNIYNSNGTTTGVRTVTLGNNAITWNGTQASSANYAFNVANSGAGGAIGATNTGLGSVISGSTTTGTGLAGSATSGNGIQGTATTGVAIRLRTTIAAANTETSIGVITKGTDGTAAAGLGGYLSLAIEDDASNDQEVARIGWVATSTADGAETADFKISTANSGSITEKFRVTGNGRVVLTGRFSPVQGADVASVAGAIALGLDGNSFEITGTNAITLISNLNWVNGNKVTLLFTSTASLTDGTANSGTDIGMELAGNTNFTGSAGATLTLLLSEIGGTQRWREVARSVN